MKKILIYSGIAVIILLLGLAYFADLDASKISIFKISGDSVKENSDIDLVKYKSREIPEECRLPDYEQNLESWKEHLGHHQETQYCLEYYK